MGLGGNALSGLGSSLRQRTWGCALRAPPQAVTSQAFSPKDRWLAAFYFTENSEEPFQRLNDSTTQRFNDLTIHPALPRQFDLTAPESQFVPQSQAPRTHPPGRRVPAAPRADAVADRQSLRR